MRKTGRLIGAVALVAASAVAVTSPASALGGPAEPGLGYYAGEGGRVNLGYSADQGGDNTFVQGSGADGGIIGGWVSGMGRSMAQGLAVAGGAVLTAGGAYVVLNNGRESAPGDGTLTMTAPDLASGPVDSAITLHNNMDRDAEAYVRVECIDSSSSVTTYDPNWPSGAITGFANSGYPYIAPGDWVVNPCPVGSLVAGVRITRAVYQNYGGWTGWGGVGRETVTVQAPGDYLNYRVSVVTRTCAHVNGSADGWVNDDTTSESSAHTGSTWTAVAPACPDGDTMVHEDVSEGVAGGWQDSALNWDITQGAKWCATSGIATCGMTVHLLNSDGSDLLCVDGVSRCADWVNDPTASCYWGVVQMGSPLMCGLLRDQWKADAVPDGGSHGIKAVPTNPTQTTVPTNSASVTSSASSSPTSSSSASSSSSPSSSPTTSPSSSPTSTSTSTTTTTTQPSPSSSSTPTSTAVPPAVDPNPPTDPSPGSGSCFNGWSLSGLLNGTVVTNAVSCALEWAFVPTQSDLQTETNAALTQWNGSALGALFGQVVDVPLAFTDQLNPSSASCAGPAVTLPLGHTSFSSGSDVYLAPFDACHEPTKSYASYTKLFLTVLIGLGGILAFRSMVGRIFGWSFTSQDGDI